MAEAVWTNSADAFGIAKHVARYAHRQSVVWRGSAGWHVADYGPASVRAAMLATGTQGRFTVVSAHASVRTGWRAGVRQLRSFAAMGITK